MERSKAAALAVDHMWATGPKRSEYMNPNIRAACILAMTDGSIGVLCDLMSVEAGLTDIPDSRRERAVTLHTCAKFNGTLAKILMSEVWNALASEEL